MRDGSNSRDEHHPRKTATVQLVPTDCNLEGIMRQTGASSSDKLTDAYVAETRL